MVQCLAVISSVCSPMLMPVRLLTEGMRRRTSRSLEIDAAGASGRASAPANWRTQFDSDMPRPSWIWLRLSTPTRERDGATPHRSGPAASNAAIMLVEQAITVE